MSDSSASASEPSSGNVDRRRDTPGDSRLQQYENTHHDTKKC